MRDMVVELELTLGYLSGIRITAICFGNKARRADQNLAWAEVRRPAAGGRRPRKAENMRPMAEDAS